MPRINDSKYMVQAGWSDIPHLSEMVKADLLENTPRHLRDARTKGTPSLGSGAIYPIEQSEIMCAPFAIPKYFAKGYGMDVGWNKTAAIFGAWDRENDIVYLYAEHYRGAAEPSIHADAIKARGEWLIGAVDYAGGYGNGARTVELYSALGLNVMAADKSIDVGIMDVMQRLSSGRLKVFSTCQNWFAEHRLYRRDDKGRIVKAHDHLMDCTRYLIRMLTKVMQTEPLRKPNPNQFRIADQIAGY